MKPTKNRFFCVLAQRSKMLFETKSQADNFIKFNSNEMEELGGKVPVRSYYCSMCCGWHVTSNPNAEYFETHQTRAEKAVEDILKQREEKKKAKESGKQEIGNELFDQGKYCEACKIYLEEYHRFKNMPLKKDNALRLLNKAFESECLFVKSILEEKDRDVTDEHKKAKNFLKQLSRAAQRGGLDYKDYIQTLKAALSSMHGTGLQVGLDDSESFVCPLD